jgi:hypothetical protein
MYILTPYMISREIGRLIGDDHDHIVKIGSQWAVHSQDAKEAFSQNAEAMQCSPGHFTIIINGRCLPQIPLEAAVLKENYGFDDFTERHLMPAIQSVDIKPALS